MNKGTDSTTTLGNHRDKRFAEQSVSLVEEIVTLLSHNDDDETAEEGGYDNTADCNKDIIIPSDICELVMLFFVFDGIRCIPIVAF